MASSSNILFSSLIASALLVSGCRKPAPLAACIPADSALIAGADLSALRASPIYSALPQKSRDFLAQFAAVSFALGAYNGRDLLVAARGDFRSLPPGAEILAPDIALFGSQRQIAAARAQYGTGKTGAPELMARAGAVNADAQLWTIARGDAPLPLSGNAENLARVFRNAAFVTLTARLRNDVTVEVRASARSESAARFMEETLRADLTLAAAAEQKQPALAGALRSVQVTRAGSEVVLDLTLSAQAAARLLELL